MANYYNINRSLETYELRLIDPDDGQLKSIFNISSIGGGGVQPSDVYTKSEVDTLLSGDLAVSSLQSTNNIQTSSTIRTNTFNVASLNTKISFNDDTMEYMKYENSTVDDTFNGLKILDTLYTMDIYPQSIKIPYNNKIAFIDTDGTGDDYYNQNYINITIDGGIQRLNQVVMGNGEHRFYCGDIATASDGDLVMKMNNTRIDIYKPLYLNDTLFEQGGSNSGAFSEDVVIADTYKLKTDTISTNGLNDMIFEIDTLGEFFRCQLSDLTVRLPNNRSFLSQNLFSDIIKPIALANNISLQGQNDTNDGYEEYVKINSTTKKVDFNKPISSITCNEFNSEGNTQVDFKRNTDTFMQFKTDGRIHIPRQCFFASIVGLDTAGSLSMVKRPESSIQIFEFSNTFGTNGKYRFKLASNNILEMTTTLIQATRNLQCDAGIKTNTINSNGDNDLVIQRNGTEYFKLTSTANTIEVADTSRILTPSIYTDIIACNNLGTDTVFYGSNTIENQAVEYFRFNHNNERVDFSKSVRLGNALIIDTAEKLTMRPSLETGVNIFDIRNLHPVVDNPMIRFRVGTGAGDSIVCEMRDEYVSMARNVIIGTAYKLQTNIIDTNGDNDLIFQRNATEVFKVRASDSLILGSDASSFSSPKVYSNEFLNRTLSFDTVFYGANATSDGRVEYMKWNRTAQQLDFNAPIDNTGIAVIGNIVDTTVSDERLKTNIEDVECNFTECVKNVKVKTFEYTNEKYKDNDKYGFIAQELQKHLPKEFNHIVKENKEKKSDDKFLSINYMKVNLLLWGALQETLTKVEHLESSVYELQEELKDKKKPKPKAKAKSKNVN